ncbi:MBL fold metallo-hydrolase [Thermomicrobium sp. 4228-Ro]|uniref:MBL fold metallo-hydrolase n=1 Tax=Thermomicrobium sp. 4228-Ro TaxID=2993937 RepID=UPI0022490927|nr:MBL fold metallo-hydrolase [Thermomicrobium sp. 4228-Ro]MCX2725930.1 MBL fold metallo-hydrolase [Thermomicrobium sp. 4228-Ro]
MRVIVLGGSAACPNPRQGCSGYLVSDGTINLLLDCGPGIIPELLAHVSLDDLYGILLSHLHQDHMLDLIPLRYGLKYAPGLRRRHLPVWIPPGGRAFFDALGLTLAHDSDGQTSFFEETYEFLEFDPTAPLALEQWHIRFHRTRHWIPCWAMRLEIPGRGTIAYTADTGWDEQLVSFLRGADLLIIEATLPDDASPAEREGHLTISEAGRMATLIEARQVVLTHYWSNNNFALQLAAAVREFGKPVEIARPGLVLELTERTSP